MTLWELSARELLRRYARREISPTEVVEATLERIARIDPAVRAFITVRDEGARARARALEADGWDGRPLWGIPVAVKDNICTAGARTTCASRMLESFVPPYSATVVERCEAAGAIVLGKTNLDEFAMGSSTENSAFFSTRNPWDLERVPGGSSGGSAAAVAARMAPLALGSDTGGSVRQPAAFCGVVGLKPTYGTVSRYGLVAFASSLDQIGPIGRTVADVALLAEAIMGPDPRDSTSAPPSFLRPIPWDALNRATLQGVTVGIPDGASMSGSGRMGTDGSTVAIQGGLDPEIEGALDRVRETLAAGGATLVEVSLPHLPYALAAYYLVASAEASSNLARYDGTRYGLRVPGEGTAYEMFRRTRAAGFGREVKRRIMLGTYALSAGYYDAYYLKAQRVRTLIKEDFTNAFGRCHLILMPTTPTPPFRLGEKIDDPLQMYLSDLYTIPVNMSGLPALALPAGFTDAAGENGKRLPIGVQLIGKPFDEGALLSVGAFIEEALAVQPPRFRWDDREALYDRMS